jgi:CubicO group peptidase (beta-lactamase class C family)
MLDWDYMIHAIENAAPDYEPGTRTGYHGLTYGYLVGEIVQRVTGRSFSQVVQELIAEPLGLDGMYIGAPLDQLPRAAKLIWPESGFFAAGSLGRLRWSGYEAPEMLEWPAWVLQHVLDLLGVRLDLASIADAFMPRGISHFDFGAEETLSVAIPAANGLFTARSLAMMYAALAGGGAVAGVRLLSPQTLARATEVQSLPPGRLVIPFDMRWRLGYHGVLTTRGVPQRAFGHFGFGGSGAWADPRRDLAVALIVNSGLGTPFGDMRILRIGGAVLRSASERRRVHIALQSPAVGPDPIASPAA